MQARAIETQCYVVASAQSGISNPKRHHYGRSLVVDPWGVSDFSILISGCDGHGF